MKDLPRTSRGPPLWRSLREVSDVALGGGQSGESEEGHFRACTGLYGSRSGGWRWSTYAELEY